MDEVFEELRFEVTIKCFAFADASNAGNSLTLIIVLSETNRNLELRPMIECRNIAVRFANNSSDWTYVLRDLNFKICEGEFVTLLGASGCGKSTLLRSIAGLQPIHAGEVLFADESNSSSSHVGFVFQEAALLDWRNVWQNVKLPLEIRPETQISNLNEHIHSLLESVSLKPHDYKKFPDQLSGGMKMRVALARALATMPKILLLDEPFAALDDVLRNQLNDLLLEIWSTRKITVLFVTHNISEALYLSNRIAVMHRGKIADEFQSLLPFPRDRSIRGTSQFAACYAEVSSSLERCINSTSNEGITR